VRRVDIRISVTYDETRFPVDDMDWAADKIAECDPIRSIGYDFESFDVKESKVTHSEVVDS
jgi:hypothetical protein